MKYLSSVLGILCTLLATAQAPMTLQDALNLALESSHQVQIAQTSRQLAAVNYSYGNAGFLPSLSANGQASYSEQNTEVTFANPGTPPISETGAVTEQLNAGLDLDYVLFNGNARIYKYNQLGILDEQAALLERQSIEQTLVAVSQAFLEAANTNASMAIAQKGVALSNDRLQRVQARYELGTATKLEVLNAEVDLRNDSTTYLDTKLTFETQSRTLNQLIGLPADTLFPMAIDYEYLAIGELENYLDSALQNNAEYLSARKEIERTTLDQKLNQAELFPRIGINAGYDYSTVEYGANFIQSSQNNGWNVGLNLSYSLFDGGRINRQRQLAQIQRERSQTTLESIELKIRVNVLNAYSEYKSSTELLGLAKRNVRTAEHNFERSEEAYKTGQITSVEVRQAQLNMLRANYTEHIQKTLLKLAEINLFYQSGLLIQ